LLVSEDLEELLALCDRILVLAGGEVMGIVRAHGADIEVIGEMMAGTPLDRIESSVQGVSARGANANG
jgi:simple sugar transport system ATP-binding protein